MGGADVIKDAVRGQLELVDIAPIVLHALEERIPTSFGGDPHATFLAGRGTPLRVDDADDPGMRATSEVYRDRAEFAESGGVADRIKSSGYGG